MGKQGIRAKAVNTAGELTTELWEFLQAQQNGNERLMSYKQGQETRTRPRTIPRIRSSVRRVTVNNGRNKEFHNEVREVSLEAQKPERL